MLNQKDAILNAVDFVVGSMAGRAATVTPAIDGTLLPQLVEALEEARGFADPAGGHGEVRRHAYDRALRKLPADPRLVDEGDRPGRERG